MKQVGDIFECVLEIGSDGRRFDDPLEYDAIFRSLGGAIHFIQASNFPNPVIHRFIYLGEGKYNFRIYDDKKSLLKKKYENENKQG